MGELHRFYKQVTCLLVVVVDMELSLDSPLTYRLQ